MKAASGGQKSPVFDESYLLEILKKLLEIPSPSGYTDQVVHFVANELMRLGVPVELTRRGAIRADFSGELKSPDRAVVAHLDTIGAMVKGLKDNGRLAVWPVGSWNARFAEGARVKIFTDQDSYCGTILPLKASGHTFNKEIDSQPVHWDNLEIRVDAIADSRQDLVELGFHVGDYVAVEPHPVFNPNGFINSRHLDNKAGVACLMACAEAIQRQSLSLPVDCHFLFTISEEVGSGASHVLHGDVAEMVSIDNSTPAPGQNSMERGVTIGMMDSSGPFDYHLTHKLIQICQDQQIPFARDVFKFYRTDAASAIEAGNDIRTSLVCFGADASHGWERTHMDSLRALTQLLCFYVQSEPTLKRDKESLAPLKGFSTQHF